MNFLRFLPAILAALACATPAVAQTVISSVPYTISASGKYVLGGNLVTASASDTAITISAPNVILDLNGFFVSGPGNDPASGQAVIAVGSVSNVTIRNGTVANNGIGIAFNGNSSSINHIVEDLNITRCLVRGIFFAGDSSGTIVRRNVISQTGGSSQPLATAMALNGGVRVERNTITDVTASGSGSTSAVGIIASSSTFLIRNTVTRSSVGIFGGKYQNNLFIQCATPFTGGTNAGGNN